MPIPPVHGIIMGKVPTSRLDAKAKYLWVVAMAGVPSALEIPQGGTKLSRGRLAHTNLTGGDEAHTAGELWFYDQTSIVINGGSSRYRPRNPEELESVARSFQAAGYKVASMGFDETGPLRTLRKGEEPEWLE